MKTYGRLSIKDLSLTLPIGWQASEREKIQTVKVDIKIDPLATPIACQTDELADTVCYDALIKNIREDIQSVRLIEHLAKKIFDLVEAFVEIDAAIKVTIKKHPDISGLGQVSFSYGNIER